MPRLTPLLGALALVGCTNTATLDVAAAPGEVVSASFRVDNAGDFRVERIAVIQQDNDNDNDNNNDGEHDDGDDAGGADNNVEQEGEHPDNDGDGDVDEDDDYYAAAIHPAFLEGDPELITDRGIYSLLGIEVNPGPTAEISGGTRFAGTYDGHGYLAATQVLPGTHGLAVGGTSEALRKVGPGLYELELLGMTLHIDRDTRILIADDPLAEEALEVEDGDDVDCEQEGEHEGNNSGC